MKLMAATGNKGKIKEMAEILSGLGIEVVSPEDLGVSLQGIEETGSTFLENAQIKAKEALRRAGIPVLADDSGLAVDILDGAPGVYSARYAGEHASDRENIDKLLTALQDIPLEKRGAQFVCTCCLLFPDGKQWVATGNCKGVIGFTPKGSRGFGYDPVFLLEDGRSFAEITEEEKNRISHRGKALRAMVKLISQTEELKIL